MDSHDVEVAQVQKVNETRRKLTKGALAAPIVAATLASKNALACSPHHLTCSGKLSGNTSSHGQDSCVMTCNYSRDYHKNKCAEEDQRSGKPIKHRRPTDNNFDTTCKTKWLNGGNSQYPYAGNSHVGYSRCFNDNAQFGTAGGKSYKCEQYQSGSTRKWKMRTSGNGDAATFCDLLSYKSDNTRWDANSDDDLNTEFSAKCTVLYLNAECAGNNISDFCVTKEQVKGIHNCAMNGTDYCPDPSQPLKCIKNGDLRNFVDQIYNECTRST